MNVGRELTKRGLIILWAMTPIRYALYHYVAAARRFILSR